MMTRRLRHFILLVSFCSFAGLAVALPPSSDLAKREKRTATPAATPARSTSSTSTSTSRQSAAPAERPSTVVVIDAGHGGFDRGGIPGQRVPESVMNLDVAQRLRAILEASGYRVVMTRNSDVFIPLGTRVAIGNQYRNGIFVCIHFNSATRRGANGIETYFYSSQSLALASAIHYNVSGVAPTLNRGVRRRGFFVLRRSAIPAVLVECGFLTNPTEASYAQSSTYRQKLAESIARGIRSRGQVSSSRVAAAGTVPLQPFIDQTRMRHPERGRRSKKIARSRHSSKKSAKKKSSAADDSGSSTKKKKSSSKKAED